MESRVRELDVKMGRRDRCVGGRGSVPSSHERQATSISAVAIEIGLIRVEMTRTYVAVFASCLLVASVRGRQATLTFDTRYVAPQ